MLTEDQVRDQAQAVLQFHDIDDVVAGVGQLTSFNQLGQRLPGHPWKSNNDKPDGWYLPKDKNKPALILETKAEGKDLEGHPTEELKKNLNYALDYYQEVLGILYNGNDVKIIRNNQPGDKTLIDAQMARKLEPKEYYLKSLTDKSIDVQEIYNLTKRINDSLKFDFGINDLYDRMIFTASALVAQRYGARLQPGMVYSAMQSTIVSMLNKSLQRNPQQNTKLHILVDVYQNIKMGYPENQDAVDNFIENINRISQSINSSHWRGEDVMGIFFNEFNRYKGKSDNGQVFTPDHVTNFMYRLINVHKDDCVFDGTCGSGAFLTKSMANMIQEAGGPDTNEAKRIKQHQLYGIEIDERVFALACANMMIHKDGKTNLDRDNTMSAQAARWMHNINWTDTGNLKKYHITKILMNPPYERKYKPIDILNNVFDNMPKGIDVAILLPDHKLEKESKRKVRKLLANNRLLKIIKLPEETFNEGVSVSIFILRTGESTEGHEVFTCEIKNDGLETVKNQGRQDIKNRWPGIEDFWVKTIERQDTSADESCQWITPDLKNMENLSYPVPQKPFEISDEDFMKTLMDYEMFKQGVDSKKLQDKLIHQVLYNSSIDDDADDVMIKLKKAGGKNE